MLPDGAEVVADDVGLTIEAVAEEDGAEVDNEEVEELSVLVVVRMLVEPVLVVVDEIIEGFTPQSLKEFDSCEIGITGPPVSLACKILTIH